MLSRLPLLAVVLAGAACGQPVAAPEWPDPAPAPIAAPVPTPAPVAAPAPLSAEGIAARLAQVPVFHEDGQRRPRVRNGGFELDGQRVFLIGGMLFPTLHEFDHDRRWVTGGHPSNRGELASLDLDCLEAAIPSRPAAQALGLPEASWWEADAATWGAFLDRTPGKPVIGDFSLLGLPGHRFSYANLRATRLFPESAFLTASHHFSGLDFLDPVGRRLYETYFLTGVEASLSQKLNVFCWELWNEPGVLDPSPRWAAPFAAWLEHRHGSIAAANTAWGTAYPSFAAAAERASAEKAKAGAYADYMLFLGDAVVEFLTAMRDRIRTVDQRQDVLFTVQPHIATAVHTGHEGLDIWKVAKAMDVVATEGGFAFGAEKPAVAGTDVLDAVMSGGRLDNLFEYDVHAGLAAAHGKPLVDHEFYVARRHGGKDRRVANRESDLVTAYWLMAAHGFDGVQLYCLNSNAHAWTTAAEAAADATRAGYLNYQLMNPVNQDPAVLAAANRAFRREFTALSPFLDRRHRRDGAVALLYSLPSKRVLGVYRDGYRNNDFSRRMTAAYAALLSAQYAVDVVFEEDLAEHGAAALAGHQAVVAPCSVYSLLTTPAVLAAFAAGGGTVVGSDDGFQRDLYGQPLAAPLVAGGRIHVPPPARDVATARAITGVLAAAGVPRPLRVEGPAAFIEARRFQQGGESLAWILNHGTEPVTATLRLEGADGVQLYEVGSGLRLPPPAGAAWTAAALAAGVEVVLPAQRRVLIVASAATDAAERLGCRQDAGPAAERLFAEQTAERALTERELAVLAARKPPAQGTAFEANVGRQRSIDLTPAANDDLAANPPLATLYRHPQVLVGVRFAIAPGARSLVRLDAARPEATLPVGGLAKQLFFLHAAIAADAQGTYRIRHASGREDVVAVGPGSIVPVQLPAPVDAATVFRLGEDLRLAWIGLTPTGYDAALSALRWRNPVPEDPVTEVVLRRQAGTIWLAAITAE